MASNTRDYNRRYARTRRFLYRLANPSKQRGRKLGQKDKIKRHREANRKWTKRRTLGNPSAQDKKLQQQSRRNEYLNEKGKGVFIESKEVEAVRKRFGWE